MNSIYNKSIGIIEDNNDLRKTIADFIRLSDEYTLSFSISDINSLNACKERPDIILLDIHLKDKNSLDMLSDINQNFPKTHIVIMTGDKNTNHILTAYKYGASGFVYKPFYLREISEVINQIVDFGCYMPPLIARTLIKLISDKNINISLQEKYNLTSKELQIIDLMNRGSSYKEMAINLGITVHAINYHTKNIYFKMEVNSQAKLMALLSSHNYN